MGAARTRRVTVVYLVLQATAAAVALGLSKQFHVARLAATTVALALTLPGAYLAWAAYRADRTESAEDTDTKAKTLAAAVAATEAQQRAQLIGPGAHRINLTFTHRLEPANNAGGAHPQGRLTDIVAYYQKLQPARLVITGEPGAGKTLLALELILGLLTHSDRNPADPVPVRLSLAGWDTKRPLPDWLADQVHEQFRDRGISFADARRLVQEHRILPVLDGLDEMDTATTPAARRRAPRALHQLNAYQDPTGNAPIVLTCRTAQYAELATLDVRMREAARIELDPVTHAQATAYLTARSTNPARWITVLDTLTTAPAGTLARALGTPWRLNLAATAYEERHPDTLVYLRDPDHLLALSSPSAVRDHLLALYLPAATSQHRTRPGRYRPDQTHRWLAMLATHLATTTPTSTAAGIDIVLHQLWPMAHPRRVRLTDAFLALIFTTLLLPLAPADSDPLGATFWALSWVAAVWAASRATVPSPRTVQLHRLRLLAHPRRLVRNLAFVLMVGLAGGLAIGLPFGLLVGLAEGLPFGLAIGLAYGVAIGLAIMLTEPLTSDVAPTDPRRPVRDDCVVGIAAGLVVGIAIGLPGGLMAGIADGLAIGLLYWLLYGLLVGLPIGIAFGMYFLTGASRRYMTFLCCSRGQLPWRLGAFLHWAYGAGLLRISGVAYQFRHRELQDWLAAHPHG
ncbi:NACHT domain-containing protein [Streptomyces sp. NBC_00038]|uniref:NACHT domain-containing protein n=1 Tax=Streptomyces sp. NBC_00038 TaxID=2903615 RepID=UPI00225C314B|nr:NACHT domain-containing protein [Streptomyces sp. NBC_00038]MCX5559506.1 NACHT domain-containing protein [Streptomyces sp. NBC_00038]